MGEFDWDELQVIKDPDGKQVEVSFIKNDEGGTIGSDFPCVRIKAPTEYFPYADNSGHFYIAYVNSPLPYSVTGTVTHTTGGICEPNSILVPQEMEASSTFTIPRGETQVRVDLNLGTVLVDVSQTPDYKAAYTATLTSVTEGRVCGEPACIRFWAGTSVIPDEPDPDPEVEEPIDPIEPNPECEPADCDALLATGLDLRGVTYGTAAEVQAIAAVNPIAMAPSAITGPNAPTYEGVWAINKFVQPIPGKPATFSSTPIDVDMPQGTGPCYTDRKALQAPSGGSSFRWSVLPEIDFWGNISSTVDTGACIFGGLLWAPQTTFGITMYTHQFPREYILEGGATGSYGNDLWTMQFSVDYENMELAVQTGGSTRRRPLTTEEARDKLFTVECHCRTFMFSQAAGFDDQGNPLINWEVRRDYALLVNGFGFDVRGTVTANIYIAQGTVYAPFDGGVYPSMFGAGTWVQVHGVVAPPLGADVSWRDYLPPNYNEARTSILRSWQNYEPPGYCERIP